MAKEKENEPKLNHKGSRVLGSSKSNSSLQSTRKQQEEGTESNDEVSKEPSEQRQASQQSQRRWSVWGITKPNDTPETQKTSDNAARTTQATEPSTSPGKSESSSITCNPPVSRDLENGKRQEILSLNSQESKEKETSWLGWKKPSLSSLRVKAAGETPPQTGTSSSQKKEVIEDLSKSPEGLKTSENDSNVKKNKDKPTSWSFWNTTQTVTESITNKILDGGSEDVPDAMLFEPSKVTEEDPSKAPTQPKSLNQVVPEFEKSLPSQSFQTSIISNFNRLKYTLGFEVNDPKHLYRTDQLNHKSIKKILIIGVHGFFPTKVIRPLIGEPTGTSIKFANEAEKSIKRFIQKEGLKDITIQKIALEKDGRVLDRVDFFFEILSKWIDELNSSDYIYIAAHSQGCPVSILLLSRLITSGLLSFSNNKKICILAMAGVNNGPFYGTDQKLFVRAYSTIESSSLMELFEFQKFDSVLSTEFLKALKVVIAQNQIKLVFVGSINDQLVPLYSSNCLHIRHPNIFRATYVDGGSNTPKFVTRVVSIANHLHNLGFSDHGVIKEVSNALAGPLTGGGHSRIYNDPQVYDLALAFSLKTNNLKYQIPLHFKPFDINVLGSNPYHLPWCMRGLLFEGKDKLSSPEVDQEIAKLFEEFENWKPETKQLKDMKYRLNGLKSKL